jgi:hypothetical protein
MTNAYVTRNGLDILIGARLDRIRSRRILVRHVHVSSCYFMLFHGPVEKKTQNLACDHHKPHLFRNLHHRRHKCQNIWVFVQ